MEPKTHLVPEVESEVRFFPEQASSFAEKVDVLFLFLVALTIILTLAICFAILFFAIRYRRNALVDRAGARENTMLEVTWSVMPFVLTMVIFGWGAKLYIDLYRPPPGADEIYVVGKQWMWKIQHPNGKREINELHVPVGRTVKLKMISEDVIHSFYIPNFRVKQDVLPGRYTTMWFEPTKPGIYHLFCAEYCGTSHSQMIGRVVVMEPADYARWLTGPAADQPAEVVGKMLYEKYGCQTCHNPAPGSRCPPLEGRFGAETQLTDGTVLTIDEEYVRESIFEPNAKIVAGYQPLMPTFKVQLGEEEVFQIIAYLKSLQPAETVETSQATEPQDGETENDSTDEPAPDADEPAPENPEP